jgi:hypothetical protein
MRSIGKAGAFAFDSAFASGVVIPNPPGRVRNLLFAFVV